jgi:hypothetical protein
MTRSERVVCGVHDAAPTRGVHDAAPTRWRVVSAVVGSRLEVASMGLGGVVEGRQRALDRVEGVCRLLARAYGESQPSVVGLRALQELLVDAGLELGRASLSWESGGEAEEVGHGDE